MKTLDEILPGESFGWVVNTEHQDVIAGPVIVARQTPKTVTFRGRPQVAGYRSTIGKDSRTINVFIGPTAEASAMAWAALACSAQAERHERLAKQFRRLGREWLAGRVPRDEAEELMDELHLAAGG